MNEFMLTKENFDRYISSIIVQDMSLVGKLKQNNNYYLVKDEDCLFWCFYILKYGMENYMVNKGRQYNVMQKIKIKSIEEIKSINDMIKQYKLKKTDIEQNMLYDTQIHKSSFFYLCLYYKLNVVIVEDNVYYECIGDDSIGSVIHMIKKEKHHYMIYNQIENDYATKYYKITNVSKPLLSISSYKVADLQDICKKLKIPLPEKTLKKEMYEKIVKEIYTN